VDVLAALVAHAAFRARRRSGGAWSRSGSGRPGWGRSWRPPNARTCELSIAARDQSISSASLSFASSSSCSRCQIPASWHSRNLRQQVIPEPQPISCGRYSHGIPVCNTNKIPPIPSGHRAACDRDTDAALTPSGSTARPVPTAHPTPVASPSAPILSVFSVIPGDRDRHESRAAAAVRLWTSSRL